MNHADLHENMNSMMHLTSTIYVELNANMLTMTIITCYCLAGSVYHFHHFSLACGHGNVC